jgi:hypothetical protein
MRRYLQCNWGSPPGEPLEAASELRKALVQTLLL